MLTFIDLFFLLSYNLPMNEKFITMTEAQDILGVSRTKMWRLIKDGILNTYSNPLDNRKTLVRLNDVEKLKIPKPKSP